VTDRTLDDVRHDMEAHIDRMLARPLIHASSPTGMEEVGITAFHLWAFTLTPNPAVRPEWEAVVKEECERLGVPGGPQVGLAYLAPRDSLTGDSREAIERVAGLLKRVWTKLRCPISRLGGLADV